MTVHDIRDAVSAPPIPRPRTAEQNAPIAPEAVPPLEDTVPQLPAAHYPWPEPWRSFRGSQPRTEFWDVATASWHSRGPFPRPRTGD